MPEIIWTRPALEDIERLILFLKDKNPDAARRGALKIKEAADLLMENPHIGKPMEDDTGRREISSSFGKKGYVLRYMLDENGSPVIIRVWHFLEHRD